MYNFARGIGGQCGHGMDVPFVFRMTALLGPGAGNKDLSSKMMSYWVNFAETGDPNFNYETTGSFLAWPIYNASGDKANIRLDANFFSSNITIEHRYRGDVCDFWDA